MAFDITSRGPVFIVVVESQIMVSPTILPLQWHSRDSNPWHWLYTICWIVNYATPSQNQLVKRKTHSNHLWHSTSHLVGLFFRVAGGSQIVVPPKITSKNFWNLFGVFFLYLVVLDWNPKRFCGLWARLKFGKLQFLIDWAFLLIVQALQKLTFSFFSLHVLDLNLYNLEQCLKLNLDIFFILVCQCT